MGWMLIVLCICAFNAYNVASGQDQLRDKVERLQQQQQHLALEIKKLLGLIEQQQKNQTSESINDDSNSFERHPGDRFMCRESNMNYQCIFHNVDVTRDTQTVYFGYADVEANNQASITLKNSNMRVLPAALLNSFRKVELLDLSALQMEEIVPSAFLHGGSIKELYLSFNDIQSLPPNVFYHLKSLQILVMDRNNLSSLPIGIFSNVPNLAVLSMSNNNLERIEDDTFNRNTSLGDLNLASNKLTYINLSLLPSLNTVNVSYNQLTELSVPAEAEMVDASHNHIRKVSGKNKEQLARLYLAHNNLSSIAWLVNFPVLRVLDLSHNELEEVGAKHLNNMHHLTTLLLRHNRLERLGLPKTFTNLQVLDVSHNALVYVERNQQQFSNLMQLYLDHNSIVTIKMLPNNTLQNLSMSSNDWDCKNLREYSYLMGKVNDIDRYCKEGYTLFNGLCCKETERPYLDRLNEQIKATSYAEMIRRAEGRCSAASALENAQGLANFAKTSEAEMLSYRSHQTDISKLEHENLQLNNLLQHKNQIILGLHNEIDASIRRYRVRKEGLVNESVNLNKVFAHLAARHEFKRRESAERRLEATGKKNATMALEKSITTLREEVGGLRVRLREARRKQAQARSRLARVL